MTLFYGDGSGKYLLPVHLDPQGSTMILLANLIAEKKPDANGNVIPPGIVEGSASFENAGQGKRMTLVIAGGTFNVADATCHPICINCCGETLALLPFDPFCPVGAILDCSLQGTNCDGTISTITVTSWSSSNTAVATISSSGVMTAVAPGQVTMSALTGPIDIKTGQICLLYPTCDQPVGGASQTMQVTPKITGISPAQGLIGATTASVTFSGMGLSGGTVSDSTGGITATVKSSSDGTLVADLAVASNAAAGNHSLTVSVGSQKSNAVNFFVQVPTSLQVLSPITVLPTASSDTNPSGDYGCLPQPGSGQAGDWGIKVAVVYQVLDQRSQAQAILSPSMEPQETITSVSFNGAPQPDPAPTFIDVGPSRISGTSQFTNTSGQFKDAPYGFCFNVSYSSYKFTQKFQVLVNGTASALLRTNVVTVTSSAAGKGNITNGSDINASR